ncbi:LegC family aminotransferase [Solitalea koreensis]|uniref:GDP-perosamine synthase n=1 Tax=Solitalea koreensis TaxID=543615 RepID=A0A521CNR3_9SPHI|nr:LegC family aminotransferase [Solitalea koreensis]SMO61025.1 aminotransferase, LLPSF_NHT_00031 family [Solitalea koreensis]
MFSEVVQFIRSQFNSEKFIPLHEPVFVGNEKEYVLETIDSTYVSSVGKFVDRFEEMVRDYTGAKYAIATTNGTAALHMALMMAGVDRGDLVITQALSFIATCNAINYIGAEPVFVDVDLDTLGLSPEKVEEFLKENTEIRNNTCFFKATQQKIAACVPMHTFGHPARIDQLKVICERYHINLVEDAAESLGSSYLGQQTGTFGLLGTYSFNGNKTITCGGGGVIVTNDERLGKLGKHLTTQAKVPHRWDFVHDHIGYNYRLPNLNAALACAQMEQLDVFINNKRELSKKYKEFFDGKGFNFVVEPQYSRSNYWLNAILLNDREQRDAFLTFTNDKGVMTRPVWALMTRLEMFKHCIKADLANSEWIEDRLVNIPSSVRL